MFSRTTAGSGRHTVECVSPDFDTGLPLVEGWFPVVPLTDYAGIGKIPQFAAFVQTDFRMAHGYLYQFHGCRICTTCVVIPVAPELALLVDIKQTLRNFAAVPWLELPDMRLVTF